MLNGDLGKLNSKQDFKITCSSCRLRGVCLPAFVDVGKSSQRESLISKRKVFSRKDHLFAADDVFSSLYIVQSGSVLTYIITPQGDKQIMGFYFPGEVLGMDGISSERHYHYARAMETTSVCVVPYSNVKATPILQSHVTRILCKELEGDEDRIYMLAQRSAEQRVASFFLNLSARYALCKLSATYFHLPMARNEIANYLGLSIETVSRSLNHLKSQKLIKVIDKDIEILNLKELVALAEEGAHQNDAKTACGHLACTKH